MKIPAFVRLPLLEVGYRLGGWPRRVAAVLCLAIAAVGAWHARDRPAAQPGSPLVVAARDVAAGTVLKAGDVQLAHWSPAQIPAHAVRSLGAAVGSSVGAAIDRGEPITSARLRGAGVAVGLSANQVAQTVSISGPGALALIRPGDTVDLLATTSGAAGARVVASGVRVLAVLAADPNGSDGQTAALVVAVTRATALALATVAIGSMTVTLRMPP